MGAINLARANREFPLAQGLVGRKVSYHDAFRVRSPCSINFQNSRFFPS